MLTCATEYCISGTGTNYDGGYFSAGTYDGYDYYTGDTYTLYYSTGQTRWCLATSLGDPTCLLFGKSPCLSVCPDLCEDFFNVGPCPSPTPSPTPPCNVDFDAIFDCDVPVTPSPTPTVTPTSTLTPTPTPTSPCGGRGIAVSGLTYTPTPTPTATQTPTPSPEVTRPCNYTGIATFNTLDDYIRCATSKQFRDCANGYVYSTSDVVLNPTGGTPTIGMVYDATINEINVCVVYIGNIDTISGVESITLNSELGLEVDGGCSTCVPTTTPTPTPTVTPTPTLTPSPTPQVCCEYQVTNLLFSANTFGITNCTTNLGQIVNINGGSTITVKSNTVPVGNSINVVFIDCPCVTPTVTPTNTPTPSSTESIIM